MNVPDTFQKNANILPAHGATAPAFQDFSSRQSQQLGQGIQQFGADIGKIEQDIAHRANTLRINDGTNQLKQWELDLTYNNAPGKDAGYKTLQGSDAINRPNKQSLTEEYLGKMQKRSDEIMAGMSNDAQREAFAKESSKILESFQEKLLQHELGEFNVYEMSKSTGIIDTERKGIALNYNDPKAVNESIEKIEAETYRQSKLMGKSAEWQEAEARKQTSGALRLGAEAALENGNVDYANAYLERYAKQMDAVDILAVRGQINKATDAQHSLSAADSVMSQAQPRIAPTDFDRVAAITAQSESGNKHFNADGTVVTSKAGAIGVMQVMPDTAPEAAKLAGLLWDEERYRNDPEYNRVLGRAYLAKQLQDFGGDPAKAWAAYNAGPGNLVKALEKAEKLAKLAKNDPNIQATPWLEFLPKETQDYVIKNLAKFESGQGKPKRPTLQELTEALRADPRIANNPARYKLAHQEIERRFKEQTDAIKQREDEAVATAMRGIIENGGRYTDLPNSIRSAVPPGEVDNIISFAQKISKGDDSTSPWLYQKLTEHPDELARLSEDAFFALKRELSEADFKHFSQERAKRNGNTMGSNGPGDLPTQSIKQSLDERLRMLKIDPSPKDDGGNDAARIGAIRRFVDQYFLAAQQEAGKKFTDAEVSRHLDELFVKNATFHGLISDSSGPMLSMKEAGNIDKATRKEIEAAFKRQGIDSPTDAQILNAYWNLRVTRQ
ncbi:MAG: transglycosylase SLT domain-containing protein [Zoogloeaceae bacterium]|jgi:soluble lytic murein transglycosylase|nr:transglycosylase SLT domain-containing protein [Zoogloeaceae bacterium]